MSARDKNKEDNYNKINRPLQLAPENGDIEPNPDTIAPIASNNFAKVDFQSSHLLPLSHSCH